MAVTSVSRMDFNGGFNSDVSDSLTAQRRHQLSKRQIINESRKIYSLKHQDRGTFQFITLFSNREHVK